MDDTLSYLTGLPFWNELTDDQKKEIEASAIMKHVQSSSVIYGAEECAMGLIYIISGELRSFIMSEEGREITLYRLAEGELAVLSPSGAAAQVGFDLHIITTLDTDLLVIPAAEYSDIVEKNVHARCFTYELAVQRFGMIMWVLQQILFARFDQRLAAFLLEEYRRSGAEEICMTQEQIAGYVNSAREVVARMLRRFAVEGVIENRRGTIVLKDIAALKRICGTASMPEELTKNS